MYTLKDVAKQAGVSTATASRALSNPDKVNVVTREKVHAVAKKLGYSINIMARSLRKQESKTILVILPDIGDSFFYEIIHGIEAIAHKAGYSLLLGDARKSQARTSSFMDLFISRQVDGIILLTAEVDISSLATQSGNREMPIVMTSEYFPGSPYSDVQIENEQSAARAVQYLCNLGHSSIATITGPSSSTISFERHLGYQLALNRMQLPLREDYILEGNFSFQSGYDLGRTLLLSEDPPTAIFCQNDAMAIGVLNIAKELNVAIPSQLSVVGFDNIQFGEYCEPALTTVQQPRYEIGKRTMNLLLDQLHGNKAIQHISFPTQLVVRHSAGPVPI
ncbi:LacI family DNA-binding transcriptional regulator [Reinekea sp.]|jgi:LacI family repressor for deo operon, udp, cdd, tsx, nupC, and nupG|uniref:LacI family DNA-binding transcriptional regulator n=1 Tax=Reinekea sp. TaxID=1970455 RepID=UPI003989AAFB